MYQVNAASYFDAVSKLQHMISMVSPLSGERQMQPIGEKGIDGVMHMLNGLEGALAQLAVPVTKLALRDTRGYFTNPRPGLKLIEGAQVLLNLSNTLQRELETVKAFALDARRAEFYEPALPPFGQKVQANFPCITGEIDQAGKCYACDLPTAAAFHWIRCLEAGIRAVARCLGIPDPTRGVDRNWNKAKTAIQGEIEKRWPASTGRMNGDAALFDQVYGALAGMANPYRNATMHFDAVYSDGEALHIYGLVRGVMEKIASRMDENGHPLIDWLV